MGDSTYGFLRSATARSIAAVPLQLPCRAHFHRASSGSHNRVVAVARRRFSVTFFFFFHFTRQSLRNCVRNRCLWTSFSADSLLSYFARIAYAFLSVEHYGFGEKQNKYVSTDLNSKRFSTRCAAFAWKSQNRFRRTVVCDSLLPLTIRVFVFGEIFCNKCVFFFRTK